MVGDFHRLTQCHSSQHSADVVPKFANANPLHEATPYHAVYRCGHYRGDGCTFCRAQSNLALSMRVHVISDMEEVAGMVTSLARYARVTPEALARWQENRDPAVRRRR